MLLARNFPKRSLYALPILAAAVAWYGCTSSNSTSSTLSTNPGFTQTDLTSDTASHPAQNLDKDVANPWGLVVDAAGTYYVADNHSGKISRLDLNGKALGAALTVPGAKDSVGAPTGIVLNPTAQFLMPDSTGKALLIIAGEDGSLSAWNIGTVAKIVARPTDSTSVFKGIAMAADSGRNFLYVTDFHNGKVLVFDSAFHLDATKAFRDTTIPAGFSPFNVAVMGSDLFVSYAKQKGPDNKDDESGPGNGYIDEFTTSGTLVRRFLSAGHLNSPWAMVSIPGGFSTFSNGIYIGNFGDGLINVFDSQGTFMGQVMDAAGNPIVNQGLWSLLHVSAASYAGAVDRLYFTAGPDDENHGVYGFLAPL